MSNFLIKDLFHELFLLYFNLFLLFGYFKMTKNKNFINFTVVSNGWLTEIFLFSLFLNDSATFLETGVAVIYHVKESYIQDKKKILTIRAHNSNRFGLFIFSRNGKTKIDL